MAGSKNNIANKQPSQKVNMKLSHDCEACSTKCVKGLKYIESVKAGKAGYGVRCEKTS